MAKLYKEFCIRALKTSIFLINDVIEKIESFGSVKTNTPNLARAELGVLIEEIRECSNDTVMREIRRLPVRDTSLELLREYLIVTYKMIPKHWSDKKINRYINLCYEVFGVIVN